MDQFRIVPGRPDGFAVETIFHSGRVETRQGFSTREDAQAWVDDQRMRAVNAASARPDRR